MLPILPSCERPWSYLTGAAVIGPYCRICPYFYPVVAIHERSKKFGTYAGRTISANLEVSRNFGRVLVDYRSVRFTCIISKKFSAARPLIYISTRYKFI